MLCAHLRVVAATVVVFGLAFEAKAGRSGIFHRHPQIQTAAIAE